MNTQCLGIEYWCLYCWGRCLDEDGKGGPHPPQQPGAYKIDSEHSAIQFKAQHHDAGYTWGHFVRFKVPLKQGRTENSYRYRQPLVHESVDTDNWFRDLHLRSAHYLAVWSNPDPSAFTLRPLNRLRTITGWWPDPWNCTASASADGGRIQGGRGGWSLWQ